MPAELATLLKGNYGWGSLGYIGLTVPENVLDLVYLRSRLTAWTCSLQELQRWEMTVLPPINPKPYKPKKL